MAEIKFDESESSKGKMHEGVRQWMLEIRAAQKREKDWKKAGAEAVEIYEACKREQVPFNILYSNTETLLPALYSNLPRPVVERRFKDDDPLGKVASDLCRRVLEFELDNDLCDCPAFYDVAEKAVLQALVPGRGVIWVVYEAETAEPKLKQTAAEIAADKSKRVTPTAPENYYEVVKPELVAWDNFLHGYAQEWQNVPWVGRVHFMDRAELVVNFGAKIGNKVLFTAVPGGKKPDGEVEASGSPREKDVPELAEVYEIWDKNTKKVFFVSPGYPEGFLRETEDPLELSGFFPVVNPLRLFSAVNSILPVCLYSLYENQAKELNRITVRINKLIAMLKVRGMYDSTVDGIEKVLQAEDGELIAAENVAALQNTGGAALERAIWLMPLEKVVTVVESLFRAREQCKSVIFEIMGIADVVRGASRASETLGAQEIKSNWTSLRLRRMQKSVHHFLRDLLRLMAEVSFKKLSQSTIQQMTGLSFPTAEQKAQAQAILAQAQQAQMEPPPQAVKLAQLPAWEEVIGLLQSDLQRNYRIDIETNSTVDLEATEDKQDMGELLNAIAQFFNGIAPMVQSGVLPFEAAKSILLGVIRRYRFGSDVEEQIKTMQMPQPQGGEGGEDPGAKAESAAAARKAQIELEAVELEAQVRAAETQAKMAKMQEDRQLAAAEFQRKLDQMALDSELALAKHQAAMAKAQAASAAPKGASNASV